MWILCRLRSTILAKCVMSRNAMSHTPTRKLTVLFLIILTVHRCIREELKEWVLGIVRVLRIKSCGLRIRSGISFLSSQWAWIPMNIIYKE